VSTIRETPEDRQVELPVLLERRFVEGIKRLAVVSLHPGAGSRTAVQIVAEQLVQRGVGIGVTSVARGWLDDDDAVDVPGIVLPEGTFVATAASVLPEAPNLETLELVSGDTALGDICLCRLRHSAEVPVFGPDDPAMLRRLLDRLAALSDGPALVRGAWERPGFAAPGVSDAVLLSVGAGYSSTPEGSAAAVHYAGEILGLPRCDEVPADRGWREAAEAGTPLALDRNGHVLESIPAATRNPLPVLEALASELAAVVLPEHLSDAFLVPLARSRLRCTLVVRDATRVRVSPVYHRAWAKHGGRLRVIDPMRLLAVATNPSRPGGANVEGFRELVAAAVPDLPVRDVRQDAEAGSRKSRWKFWS